MVGMMTISSRERAADLINSSKVSPDIPSKLRHLRLLKELLLQREDPALLSEFVPRLIDLQTQPASPIRKFLAELIGEIGMKHLEYLPEMMPVLIAFLTDDTPAVARQAITTGTDLFRTVLQKIAIQGLFSSELGDSLESSWTWILKFKDAVCPIAFLPGIDGVRLLAVKFVEVLILLYTPDPNDSLQLTPHQNDDGKTEGFNISWLRGGHPLLNVGDLAVEASQSLGLLLDLLRLPKVKSLSNSIIIVLINSLSAIAKKRPVFYGRVLPVLLSLDTSSSVIKGVQVSATNNSLKNAFLACLRCTHPGATPWRDRLVEALKAMDAGDLAAEAVCQVGISESTAHSTGETHPVKEDRLPLQAFDSGQFDPGRKRPIVQEVSDLVEDEDTSGKRSRLKLTYQGPVKDPLQINSTLIGDTPTLTGFPASAGDGDTGPVHQLVAMFGALVAQGEKAAGSLEILISSISSDLLAEVVMANMRHLPPTCPKAEGEEEPILNLGSVLGLISSNSLATQSSFISGVMSLLSAFPQIECSLTTQPSVSHDASKLDKRDEQTPVTTIDAAVACVGANEVNTAVTSAAVQIPCISPVFPVTEKGGASLPSDMSDVGTVESQIPGLDSTVHMDEMQETLDASHSSSTDMQGTYNEQVLSSGSTAPPDFPASGSMLPSRSEEHSPKVAAVDSSWTSSSTTTMVTLPGQLLLPKMSVPSMNLTDEQKDHLQEAAFVRIVEAYKQVKIAGGSHIRFSLLAYLGAEFPLELDTWGLLKKHILSDYMNHEGHELTLRVLYRLFGESEQDHDFFSSTTATSIYETFLLAVAETLRDSFPASDKSLSRLLGEVPYLPKAAFKMLECLCSPGSTEKTDKETQSGDRVTQGLSAVWSLILVRPSIRDACLKIALQSAIHHLEEVRMKAIRLVANKLYPMPCIAQKIEDFASEMLLSVANGCQAMEGMDAEDSTSTLQKDADSEKVAREGQSVTTRELSSDTHQSGSLQSVSSSSISKAQRCMSLYFALCTKKHFLLRQIFVIYKSIPKTVKQAVHRHIPILVRTIGSSSELLGIISDPPTGSESLLLQVLHTLTDGAAPSLELVVTVRRLYESKLKNAEILIPILSYLSKDEILPIFPRLVDLPLDKFKAALSRMLQGSSPSGATLTPAEVLIAIHGINPDRDGIPLKKVTDACSACFEQRQVFTQQVLAKVLNQLVEQIPLPLLFMRTVIQAIGVFPALVDFTMEILSRLVNKQIWKYPKLWVGFLKCAQQTKPQSFSVLLQLPAAQLENALNRSPALKPSLTAHASQPNIRPSLPRSTLVVLGLAQESQAASQAQTSQTQIAGASTSGTDATTEVTQESPAVS